MSRVSVALRWADSRETLSQVRALWSRSASLMTSTRMSPAMATIILRTVWAAAISPNLTLSSLVTPSTMWATSAPNSCSIRFSG